MKKKSLKFLVPLCLLFQFFNAFGQTPTDAIMMEKGQICAALLYNHDSWDEYWEADLLRTNGNIGTVTTQNVMGMVAAGLTKNFNLIVALPYVWTKASQGTLSSQKGIQDFGVWAKYRAISKELGPGKFNVIGEAGFSTPLSDYNFDILPLSIGMGSTTTSLRGILNYKLESGPYLTANWGYTFRGDVELDREFYWSNGPHYTNKVVMPDVIDYSATLGFLNSRVKGELTYASMITQSGSDIRRQDGPFCGTRMIGSRASALVQYYFSKPKILSVIVNVGYTMSGRNVGKSLNYGGGVAYQFGYLKSKTDN